MVGTAPVAKTLKIQMADIMATAETLQGPEIFWGSEGPAQGHEESEIKGYDCFSKFIAAVTDAGLADTLKGGEFTVLAPVDTAFDVFAENGGVVTPELLKYHCIPKKVMASGVSTADLKTVEGSSLTYRRMFRKDFIDEALLGVKSAGPSKGQNYPCDVECDNGVIHAINLVLVPGWAPPAEGFDNK